ALAVWAPPKRAIAPASARMGYNPDVAGFQSIDQSEQQIAAADAEKQPRPQLPSRMPPAGGVPDSPTMPQAPAFDTADGNSCPAPTLFRPRRSERGLRVFASPERESARPHGHAQVGKSERTYKSRLG